MLRYDTTRVEVFDTAAEATYRSYGWATRQHPSAPQEPRFTWDSTWRAAREERSTLSGVLQQYR